MQIGIGLGLTNIRKAGSGGAPPFSLTSMTALLAYNTSVFPATPVALSRPSAVVGGSNFDYSSPSAPTNVEDRIDAFLSSTFSKPALGGATNPDILAQYNTLVAGPSFDVGDILGVALSSNNYLPNVDYPTQLDANAPMDNPNTVWTHSCNGDNITQQIADYIDWKYGSSRMIDWVRIFQRRSANDPACPAALLTTLRRGRMPTVSYTAPFDINDNDLNSSHLGTGGQTIIADEWLLAFRALDGTGAPYLNGQEMRLSSETADGGAVGTVNRLGTVTTWEIVGGNDDGIVSIDSSGVIRRTAAALTSFDGVRELYVRASNANGSHAAMILLMDGGGTNHATAPAARLTPFVSRLMPSYATAPTMGNQLTIAMRYRVQTTNANEIEICGTRSPGSFTFSNGNMRLRASGGVRFSVASNASVNNTVLSWPGTSLGGSLVAANWTTLLVSIDTSVAGTVTRVARYLQPNGTSTPLSSTPGSSSAANAAADPFMGDWYFGNGAIGTISSADWVDLDYLWIGTGYADWTVQANRNLFFDDTTGRLPSGFPADGVFTGFTPRLFLAGGVGNILTGPNLAPGGTETHRLRRMPQINKALAAGSRAP